VFAVYKTAEFFNGHNTDKAHPFVEDCIAKQQPLVKVAAPCFQKYCSVLRYMLQTLDEVNEWLIS